MLMICSFFCILKGNLSCLPEAWLALVMLKCVHGSTVNGCSVGVKVFLSSRLKSDIFFSYWNTNCHVCLNLKCGVFLLAPLAWSLFIFKWMLNVLLGLHISRFLKEWAEELVSAVYCSFQSILSMLIFKPYFISFWYLGREMRKGR